MQPNTEHPVILFDGVCNLCNASVQWVLKHDPKGIFHFAALQSEIGQQYLQKFGLNTHEFDSTVLIDGDRIYLRSDAPLQLLRRLGNGWAIFSVLTIVPRPVRDGIYNWIARNRYRWFGHRESCMLPQPEWKARFL